MHSVFIMLKNVIRGTYKADVNLNTFYNMLNKYAEMKTHLAKLLGILNSAEIVSKVIVQRQIKFQITLVNRV